MDDPRVTSGAAIPRDPGNETESDEPGPPTHRRVLSWIYGLVVCAAVLSAGADIGAVWGIELYVFVSLLVYWVAETYAHVLATRTVTGGRTSWREIWEVLSEGWVLVTASYVPLAVLLVVSWIFDVGVGVNAALAAVIVMLFVAGWTAGRHSGVVGPVRLTAAALLAALMGVAMAALKFAIH